MAGVGSAAAWAISGCARSAESASAAGSSSKQAWSFTDQNDNDVSVDVPCERMVVLQHHSLDILCQLGAQSRIVDEAVADIDEGRRPSAAVRADVIAYGNGKYVGCMLLRAGATNAVAASGVRRATPTTTPSCSPLGRPTSSSPKTAMTTMRS